MVHARRLLVSSVAVAAALGACGGPPAPEKPDLARVYAGLVDSFPRVTPRTLAGFRVLIDPGHGGVFRGTVGQDSLEESRVNLGVSLYLWGLLRDAGADVHLTRASDRDFLSAADSALASDLQARVDAADSLQPDLFVSIHHNAQPERDPHYNRIETYYRAGDPASLDLALAIHRHLIRNIGIGVGEVKQGNYYVLRNMNVPAVLGESSYLTYPPVEEKLRLSRAQELEAEAYFLGIVDYLRRGIPRVTIDAPRDTLLDHVPTIACRLVDRGGIGIDPDGVQLLVNDEPVQGFLSADGSHLSFRMPWDTPNGDYDVAVSARNLGGNTSPVMHARFVISHPPAMAAVATAPDFLPRGGGVVRVHARVLDRRGLPVADGTPVSLSTGIAGITSLAAAVRGGSVEFMLVVPAGVSREIALTLACAGHTFVTRLAPGRATGSGWRSIVLRDALTRAPVPDARVFAGDSVLAAGSPSGRYGFVSLSGAMVSAPGYRPAAVPASGDTLRLTPWFDGVLLGKRFVLDPQGGTPGMTGVGPMGLPAAHVNLRVAMYLEGFLHAAGADVRLTRTSEEVRLPEDIARMTNRWHADRYLEIRHPPAPLDSPRVVRTFYFPGSEKGRGMAADLGAALARTLSVPLRGPQDTVTYPLQQTACPAIVVAAPSISHADEELRLDASWYLRQQAYGIFLGVARHFGATQAGRLVVQVPGRGRSGDTVTLDGTWTLLPGDDGTVVFGAVAAGEHRVNVGRGAARVERVVVTDGSESRLVIPAPE